MLGHHSTLIPKVAWKFGRKKKTCEAQGTVCLRDIEDLLGPKSCAAAKSHRQDLPRNTMFLKPQMDCLLGAGFFSSEDR